MFVFILLWHTHDLLHSYTLVLCAQLSQRPRGGQNQDRPFYTLWERLCVWVCVIGWHGCPLALQRGFSHRVAIFATVGVFHAAPSSKSNSQLWSLTLAESEEPPWAWEEVTRVQLHTECIDNKAEMSLGLAEWGYKDISGSRMKQGKNGRFLIVIIIDSKNTKYVPLDSWFSSWPDNLKSSSTFTVVQKPSSPSEYLSASKNAARMKIYEEYRQREKKVLKSF